ncbi:hypothetical protein BRAO285_1120001 [Bradyrhizobium sp. ORS 285]|nr:hypothetical protein BRAO285_1120001 [Bradyrhizobium sp. ORS 285]
MRLLQSDRNWLAPHSPTPLGAGEPDWLVARQGKHGIVVSDNTSELTSNAIQTCGSEPHRSAIRAGRPQAEHFHREVQQARTGCTTERNSVDVAHLDPCHAPMMASLI